MRRLALFFLLLPTLPLRAADAFGPVANEPLFRDALAAEAKLDSRRALDLLLALEKSHPSDALLCQKIARQYSDLVAELPTDADKRAYARHALDYSERAVALAPRDPVNVLSVAISYGKLALYSETRDKVAYSRHVKEEAERALALDPNYAWAHHVLGRWHYEVADLGATSRFFVRALYGGLPPASPAEAIRHLTRATELEPHEPAHHIELAFAYLAIGDKAKARAGFTRGLALPSHAKYDEPTKERARAALAKL